MLTDKPCDLLREWMASTIAQLPIESHLIDDECHISLTRTLILKFHWIDSFVDSLKKICRSTPKFTLQMINIKVYCNEEKTRTFMGIECQSIEQSFMHLTKSIDKLLIEYQLPPFYEVYISLYSLLIQLYENYDLFYIFSGCLTSY